MRSWIIGTWRWIKWHRKTTAALMLLFLFLALNAFALVHAHAMTHFVAGGDRTAPPEMLTRWQKFKVLLTGVRIPRPENAAMPAAVQLPFDTHRLKTADGVELEAWFVPHDGAKGLILMFHSYASCKATQLLEAKALYELGYALLMVDFRGSGGSQGNATTVGYLEAEDVAAAARFAQEHWPHEPLILYGQSMGAAAILRAVALGSVHPRAIIVECPFDRMLSTVENRFAAMKLPAFPLARLLIFWGSLEQGYWGFGHNPADYARQVTCPTLLMHGQRDPRVTRAQADSVYANLAGAKQFALFEDAEHMSYLRNEPEHWRKVVAGFLDASRATGKL